MRYQHSKPSTKGKFLSGLTKLNLEFLWFGVRTPSHLTKTVAMPNGIGGIHKLRKTVKNFTIGSMGKIFNTNNLQNYLQQNCSMLISGVNYLLDQVRNMWLPLQITMMALPCGQP